MNILFPRVTVPCLLLLACSLASSCSSDPAVQTNNVVVEQAKEIPKSLDNVVVATEDEVPSWTESTDKLKPSSQKTDSDK